MQNQITEKIANNTMMPLEQNEIDLFTSLINPVRDADQDADIAIAITQLTNTLKNSFSDIMLTMKEMKDELTIKIEDNTSAQTRTAKAIEDAATKQRKQLFAIENEFISGLKENNNKGLSLHSSMNKNNQVLWRDKISGNIALICLSKNRRRDRVYKDIYAGLLRKGYDVYAIARKNGIDDSDESILDMCAKSDILRIAVEYELDNFDKKANSPKAKYTFKEANRCPENISELISKFSHTGYTSGRTYRNAKLALLNKANIKEEALLKEIRRKYHLSKCNFWFAVSKKPELMDMLKSIVENKEA